MSSSAAAAATVGCSPSERHHHGLVGIGRDRALLWLPVHRRAASRVGSEHGVRCRHGGQCDGLCVPVAVSAGRIAADRAGTRSDSAGPGAVLGDVEAVSRLVNGRDGNGEGSDVRVHSQPQHHQGRIKTYIS